MHARELLLPLLLAAGVTAPAGAQELEPIGDWFQYMAATDTSPDALLLLSLGYQERGMLLGWSCPRGRVGLSLMPGEGVPKGDVRVAWRLDADPPDTVVGIHPPRGQPALVFPLDRTLELTRGASTSSYLVIRLIPQDGAERAWAYSLDDAEEALGRLSCVRAARQADASGWQRRPRIPMTPEVQQVQGEPPPQPGPPPQAGPPPAGAPPEEAAPAAPRLLNEQEAERAMDTYYDDLLRDAGVTGEVHLDLTLNADGTVRTAQVVRTTHNRFSASARRVAPRLRFTPPPADGAVVRVRMSFVHRRGEIQVLGLVPARGPTAS